MLKRFLVLWAANALGLFLAAGLLSGIDYGNNIIALIIASLIFGLVNSLIRPLVVILSLPAIVLTMGLFTLIVNALMLYLTSRIYPNFQVKSIWSAIAAVIIVWLVNYIFDIFTTKGEKI